MVVTLHEDTDGMGGPPLCVVRSHFRACPLGLVSSESEGLHLTGVEPYNRPGLHCPTSASYIRR